MMVVNGCRRPETLNPPPGCPATRARSRAFYALLVFGLALHLISPGQTGAWPLTVCGDKLLGVGPLGKSDLTLFGKTLKPSCDINGTWRLNVIGGRIDADDTVIFAPQLDLDLNLQLTATERIHGLVRPFDHGVSGAPARPDRATQWRILRAERQPDSFDAKLDFEVDRLWAEMEPLTWLSPGDTVPLDILFAGGLIPLAFHNNYWLNDDVLGFAVSKNNIYLPPFANLNVIAFTAFDELNRFSDATVTGLGVFIDHRGYFVETTFAYALDETVRDDRWFAGVSVTKQLGLSGVALRVLVNENDGVQQGPDLGAIFILETERTVFREWLYAGQVRLYANGFYATEVQAPLSGGNVARQGFLLQTDRSIPIPALLNRGIDSGGFALGVIFNPEGTVTVTPEVGFVRDNRPRIRSGSRAVGDLEQVGVGLRVQAGLARLLLPGRTFPWYKADYDKIAQRLKYYLYGTQLRTTLYYVTPTAGETEYAARVELVYDF